MTDTSAGGRLLASIRRIKYLEGEKRRIARFVRRSVLSAPPKVPSTAKDIRGKYFGELHALAYLTSNEDNKSVWVCQCSCGNLCTAVLGQLTSGQKRSCGCAQNKQIVERTTTHGLSKCPEYSILYTIMNRCENELSMGYSRYGGRGISICSRWKHGENGKTGIECFLKDMGPRPSTDHSIDRIDNDGNYEPDNCRWVTRTVQARNTRRNIFLDHDGKTMCINDWSKETGIKRQTLSARIKAGWPVKDALTKHPGSIKRNRATGPYRGPQ